MGVRSAVSRKTALVEELCILLVRFFDMKWKIRPTDLAFDWVGDFLYKEYMARHQPCRWPPMGSRGLLAIGCLDVATLKDFEALVVRCPAQGENHSLGLL